MRNVIQKILAKTLRPMAKDYLKNQAHQQIVDNRVDEMQGQIDRLRLELDSLKGGAATPQLTMADVIYEKYREDLERYHMDEIVAFDIDTKQIAGFGHTIREAYDNARASVSKQQFYFKRVGGKYLHRL